MKDCTSWKRWIFPTVDHRGDVVKDERVKQRSYYVRDYDISTVKLICFVVHGSLSIDVP